MHTPINDFSISKRRKKNSSWEIFRTIIPDRKAVLFSISLILFQNRLRYLLIMKTSKSFIMLLLILQEQKLNFCATPATTILRNSVIAMINEYYSHQHTTMHLIVQFNDATSGVIIADILSSCKNLSFIIESIDSDSTIGDEKLKEMEKRRNVMIFASNFNSLSAIFR